MKAVCTKTISALSTYSISYLLVILVMVMTSLFPKNKSQPNEIKFSQKVIYTELVHSNKVNIQAGVFVRRHLLFSIQGPVSVNARNLCRKRGISCMQGAIASGGNVGLNMPSVVQ